MLRAGLVTPNLDIFSNDTSQERLDRLVAASVDLPPGEIQRSERLLARISRLGLTKYNISGALPNVPPGPRSILVPGQVEDDASVLCGAGDVRTNLELLHRVRNENPDARILWKPHPDVEAGLRKGAIDDKDLEGLADFALVHVGAAEALGAADEVWTITSTLGFEALLRGVPVTCLGMPFYAGRGLTNDRAPRPAHRNVDATLAGFAHACLIGYPRYFDPRTGAPISPEEAVTLLAEGIEMPRVNKVMAWLQSLIR